jgi:hypothetical protein
MESFEEASCAANEFGSWTCPDDSPITALGCDQIAEPGEMLGALSPSLPIARCLYYPTRHQQEDPDSLSAERLYNQDCLLPVYVRYAIFQDGQFATLNTREDLRRVFAPLQTSEEALSYALAATGLEAKYGLQHEPNFRYLADQMEDTYVSETEAGFEVLLYHYRVCGCGPHTTSAFLFRVTRDGDLQEISSTPVYEDPAEDGLCVD